MENYIIANKTDVGKTRQVNEDSMITFDSPNGRVIAVCDGMGGQTAGDVASQLACDIIRDILENNTFANPSEAITRSILAANQGILHRVSQNPELEGMGATCVMLIIKDGLVYYGWVGDSRIYYLCDHSIRQISKDQSYVQSLVDSGEITAEEAEHHPQKNEIINALGIQGMTPPVLCQMPIKPEPGSIFLLCSDGLSGMVDNAKIESTLNRNGASLQDKAEELVDLANQQGGLDNITVQLVEFPGDKTKVSPTNKSEQTKSKQKPSFVTLAIGIITAMALAVIVYFLFCNKKRNNENRGQDGVEVIDQRKYGREEPVTPSPQKTPVKTIEKNEQPKTFNTLKPPTGNRQKKKAPRENIIEKNNKRKGRTGTPILQGNGKTGREIIENSQHTDQMPHASDDITNQK